MTARERLPNRRPSQVFSFEAMNLRFTASVSHYPDGRIAELFVDNHKAGSAVGTLVRDAIAIARVNPALIDVLELRAWARALLLAEREIESVAEAVDPLQAFAVASGLVAQIGADAVHQIITQEFQDRLCYEPAA